MANPQTENGFVKISTELFDALCKIRISGEARQMLDVIIRKTYGFNKKIDMISTSQFMQVTCMPRFAIHRARKKLLKMNLITVTKKGDSQTLTYSIQKNYDKWLLLPKKVTVTKKGDRCNQKRSQTVTKKVTHNIQYTIDNYTIDKDNMFLSLWVKYPSAGRHGKDVALKRFLKDFKVEELPLAEKALNNYINSERVKKNFILRGSKWFEEWRDWINYENKTRPKSRTDTL